MSSRFIVLFSKAINKVWKCRGRRGWDGGGVKYVFLGRKKWVYHLGFRFFSPAANSDTQQYFLPSADYKVVAEGLGITFQPTHPSKTLLKSVTKTPSLTHLMTNVT
jgi:hypothetical protein